MKKYILWLCMFSLMSPALVLAQVQSFPLKHREATVLLQTVQELLLERINKSSSDAITLENLEAKSLADTGLDSVEQVELVTDFEEKFNCTADTDFLMQITSLSEFSLTLYQAACRP